MNPLLQMSEQDIERLDQRQFADILNKLLKAEAQRYGIPPLNVKTTLRVDDPDGGVDARVEHSVSLPPTCRVPEGLSVWQYKTGDPSPKDIREVESQKPGVQEAVRAGGAYCFAVGKGGSDTWRRNREQAVNHCYLELGQTPKGHFLTAQDVADWVSDCPSVALHPHFGRPVSDELITFEGWNSLAELRVDYIGFEADDQRRAIIDELGRVISDQTGFIGIRIAGRAGIGKTRLALEAIRANGLEHDTLYALSPSGIPSNLFSHIETRPSLRVILVVDECTYEETIRLQRLAQRCGDRLVLITVGPDQPATGGEAETTFPFYWLERLDDDAIQRIVREVAPTMYPELVSYVVRSSEGYVKLATAMAETLARNPDLAGAAQVTGMPNIRFILQSLVPDQTDRRAMQALSLLRRVGLDGDVAVEGKVVADFMGIDFRELKLIAEQMRQRGLVVKRGRYRYVTPHLLAVWFATEVWQAMGEDIVNNLLLAENELPFAAKEALLERLADLGEEEIAAPVVERLLGPEGLFPSVNELDDSVRSRVFAILAKAAPNAATSALERVLGHLPRDQLLNFRAGRRHVIWTLEKLLWLEGTFWTAARLLLKLAEAENETFGNNATETWCEIFYTHLGGTPVPALERHTLIREALESPLVETRLIGVRAISSALSTFETRMRGSELGGYITPKEWRPETWGEIWKVRRSALNLLDRALDDPNSQVAEAAREVLTSTAPGLVLQGLADDVLLHLKNLPLRSESEKRDMWELLQRLLHFQVKALKEEQRVFIQQWAGQLVGTSFRDRLRRWVGKVSPVDWSGLSDSGKTPEDMAASMAEEGYQSPDALRPELDWLASPDAVQFYHFGRRLGELDSPHKWLEDLIALVRKGGNTGLLSAYLRGRAEAGESDWVERLLDSWAENDRDMAPAVFDATWRLGGTDEGAARIVALIDKDWIPVAQLGWLSWGGWVAPLSTDAMSPLMERLVQDESPQATEASLSLLTTWLKHHLHEAQVMTKYASQLLIRPCAVTSQGMFQFYWVQVSAVYLPELSAEVAEAILRLFAESDFLTTPEDRRMDVLKKALVKNPAEVWPLIGNILLRRDEAGYRLRLSMSNWGVECIGTAELLEWAEEHKPKGARVLAELAIVGDNPLAPLPWQLLVRFGEDDYVGHALANNFLSGLVLGSMVAWLQSKLDMARNWRNDEHPSVRSWADRLVRNIEADIKRTRQREEEEELFWG